MLIRYFLPWCILNRKNFTCCHWYVSDIDWLANVLSWNVILYCQSLGEFLFLLFFFFFSLLLLLLSAFCLLVLLTPSYLDQTFPKSFPNLSARLSLAQLSSPNLASFSPKPFGHVLSSKWHFDTKWWGQNLITLLAFFLKILQSKKTKTFSSETFYLQIIWPFSILACFAQIYFTSLRLVN